MNFKNLFVFFILTFSVSAIAEKLSLFAPIPGAILYEIQIISEVDQKTQTFKLETPVLDTDKIVAGNYIMTARYMNVRENWSAWTDKASLKLVKKIINNTRDVFEDKFPFGGSVGFASLATKLSSNGYEFKSDESVVRSKVFIQRLPFKIAAAYDKSAHLIRFDTAVLKQINPTSAAGINLWLVNFDGRDTTASSKGLINYTQTFFEYDYSIPFLDRWYFGAKFGLGWAISYYVRPELSYSIPFGDQFFASFSATYEKAHVEQSDFEFDANGYGGFVNISYFLEM
jgi:hypothetical protein